MNRENRGCTDVCFLLFFIAGMLAMVWMAHYGQKHGDVGKLLAPLDGEGNFCGHTPGYEEYHKLYISDFSLANVM